MAYAKGSVCRQIFRQLHARNLVEFRAAILLGHATAEQADLSRFFQQLGEQAGLVLFEIGNEGNHFVADKFLGGPANEFLIVGKVSGRENVFRSAGFHQETAPA